MSGRGTSDRIMEKIDGISIDDFLRGLIEDSDLEGVVCCLNMIAEETKHKVEMYSIGETGKYSGRKVFHRDPPDTDPPTIRKLINEKIDDIHTTTK